MPYWLPVKSVVTFFFFYLFIYLLIVSLVVIKYDPLNQVKMVISTLKNQGSLRNPP